MQTFRVYLALVDFVTLLYWMWELTIALAIMGCSMVESIGSGNKLMKSILFMAVDKHENLSI